MGGFKGGLNQGIWIVSDGDQHLVLKQSRCQRIASGILTEAENFVRILKDHPEILDLNALFWRGKGKNEMLYTYTVYIMYTYYYLIHML